MIPDRRRSGWLSGISIQDKFALAYGFILVLFTATCLVFNVGVGEVKRHTQQTSHSEEVLKLLGDMQSAMLNQESGLRGYALTRKGEFLLPYYSGEQQFDGSLAASLDLTAEDEDALQAGLLQLRTNMRRWREEFAVPLLRELQQPANQVPATLPPELLETGKRIIEEMRGDFAVLRERESVLLQHRAEALSQSLDRTRLLALLMLLFGVLFGIAVVLGTSRAVGRPLNQLIGLMTRLSQGDTSIDIPHRSRGDEVGVIARGLELFRQSTAALAAREWSKAGLAKLSAALPASRDAEEFASALMRVLCQLVDAPQGTLFLWNERSARLEPAGGYALTQRTAARAFRLGEGPVGQAARDRVAFLLRDLPEGYLEVSTGLGATRPRCVLLQPMIGREGVLGVVELALFREPDATRSEFLGDAAGFAALSLETLLRGLSTLSLLRQTQKHQEELRASEEALRAQQEELQATNERLRERTDQLEKQGQRLRASEEELRAQAEELRTTNVLLEEKANELRAQKSALEEAQAALEEKTVDLERASRYKSEFLANMSHELRTPLNSMLILSKSLADNEDGNLNAEQIESARIVYDSGRSLLMLINDILDLSKVEAGKMQVVVEEVNLAAFASMIERNFRCMAEDKKLELVVKLAPRLPATIESDGGKINQIVTNLLSNAIKFTERGSVTLEISRPDPALLSTMPEMKADSSVLFRVTDSGIGIPPAKMVRIFQAFEQGDSSTSRRFGGTGLGLSICKGLTQLLHGEIRVSSETGRGSVFSMVLPQRLEGVAPAAPAPAALPEAPPEAQAAPPAPAPVAMMHAGAADVASILIIEDDAQFAEILAGIARSKLYRALVAHDGETGLRLARQYRPSGILLDIGLPGMDGWQVMDALKADEATAAIPVHLISAADESTRALAMGAASFLKKPVSKPQIAALLDTLPRPGGGARWRILVIDDYEPDRRLIREMLKREPVDIAEAPTAHEALARMERERFDLLILDLGLPVMDGFEFLQVASARGDLPAVVIHSGRELTREETMKLREYTDTIVMKNAPSPQRLLDEVTLFLHSIRRVGTPEAPATQTKVQEFGGRTVLVVDDDMRNIFALSKALRARGLKIVMAQDGRKALTQLENNPDISLVLMDIMMPGMDGYEAMRQIRAREAWRKLPIIAVTAKAMVGDREKCMEAGATDYCPKPIEIEELVEQMRRLMI